MATSLETVLRTLVHSAIARAAAKKSRSLELDDLLALINHLMAEQQQSDSRSDSSSEAACNVAIESSLALIAKRAWASEDRLIAKLHCEIVYRDLNLPKPNVQHKAAAQWRQWAQEYPAIRVHCLEQAAACFPLTTAQQEIALFTRE